MYDIELPNNHIKSCPRGFIHKEILPQNDENHVVVNNQQIGDSGIPEVELDSPGTAETAGCDRPSSRVETRSMKACC